jgi:hypothetical protein
MWGVETEELTSAEILLWFRHPAHLVFMTSLKLRYYPLIPSVIDEDNEHLEELHIFLEDTLVVRGRGWICTQFWLSLEREKD